MSITLTRRLFEQCRAAIREEWHETKKFLVAADTTGATMRSHELHHGGKMPFRRIVETFATRFPRHARDMTRDEAVEAFRKFHDERAVPVLLTIAEHQKVTTEEAILWTLAEANREFGRALKFEKAKLAAMKAGLIPFPCAQGAV